MVIFKCFCHSSKEISFRLLGGDICLIGSTWFQSKAFGSPLCPCLTALPPRCQWVPKFTMLLSHFSPTPPLDHPFSVSSADQQHRPARNVGIIPASAYPQILLILPATHFINMNLLL